MLWHLESAGEASRLRDVNTEPLYIQSMLTVMSLTFVSGILLVSGRGGTERIALSHRKNNQFFIREDRRGGKGMCSEGFANFPCMRLLALQSEASYLLIADNAFKRLQDRWAMTTGRLAHSLNES